MNEVTSVIIMTDGVTNVVIQNLEKVAKKTVETQDPIETQEMMYLLHALVFPPASN